MQRDKKVKAKDSILSKYPKLLWDVQKKIYGPVLPALVKGAEYLPIVGDLVNPPELGAGSGIRRGPQLDYSEFKGDSIETIKNKKKKKIRSFKPKKPVTGMLEAQGY